MENYAERLKHFIQVNDIDAYHYVLSDSCHSVEEAAIAMEAAPNDFVKNICMIDESGTLIIAIVKGEDRASTSRAGKALHISRPRLATESEILELTGFPVGGVPSFGCSAIFLVDPKVTEMHYIFTGGGTPHSLIKISVEELLKANKGIVTRVRK
jgi:prolyl-tRNA editing enzyme YbaK/EbsC (Cys-tRNA(Pro) deacylase)